MSETIKCLREGCKGELIRYPMDLLLYPPIQQWECKYCDTRHRLATTHDGSPGRLYIYNDGRPYSWRDMYLLQLHINENLRVKNEE